MENLRQLQNEGRLVVAGPLPKLESVNTKLGGVSGSLIVADFDSRADALTWVESDVFYQEGVYKEIKVFPFKQVLP